MQYGVALPCSARKLFALHYTELGSQHPSDVPTPAAFFQSNAHRGTSCLIATVVGKAADLRTALDFSYTLCSHTTCRRRAILMDFATLVFLRSPPATASKRGTCRKNEACASQITSAKHGGVLISK